MISIIFNRSIIGYVYILLPVLCTPVMQNCNIAEPTNECSLEQLNVSFYDVRKPSFGFSTLSLPFIFSIKNDSPIAISSSRYEYELFINNNFLGSGKTYFPPIETGEVRYVPSSFVVSYKDIGQSLMNLLKTSKAHYTIIGTLSNEDCKLQIKQSYE